MTPQELKNSILQLAIQGKLVEQCPEEGTAVDLYKQIQAEKRALFLIVYQIGQVSHMTRGIWISIPRT